MSPLPCPVRALLAPLLAGLCSGACATLLDPGPPVLRIRTDTVVATVRNDRGDTLGTTPLRIRLAARPRQTLVITAPGYDSVAMLVGRREKEDLPTLINPLSWPVDAATGALWRHEPAVLDVRLAPSARREPPPDLSTQVPLVAPPLPAVPNPPPGGATERAQPPRDSPTPSTPDGAEPRNAGDPVRVPDHVAAVVLREFADAAEAAGCEPLLVGAWRDAARVLQAADSAAPTEDVRRQAAAEVDRAAPELRELCATPGPRVAALRDIRERLARDEAPAADGVPVLSPVFFAPDEWNVRDDSVRARLRALGARLAGAPVTLVVEGFADGAELRHRELGYQRAAAVIQALREGGLPADCCVALSHSGAGALAASADPRLNRRVTLTPTYRETP